MICWLRVLANTHESFIELLSFSKPDIFNCHSFAASPNERSGHMVDADGRSHVKDQSSSRFADCRRLKDEMNSLGNGHKETCCCRISHSHRAAAVDLGAKELQNRASAGENVSKSHRQIPRVRRSHGCCHDFRHPLAGPEDAHWVSRLVCRDVDECLHARLGGFSRSLRHLVGGVVVGVGRVCRASSFLAGRLRDDRLVVKGADHDGKAAGYSG